MTPEDHQRYFFVHVMKTAGTVITMALRRSFGEEAVYPGPADQHEPLAVLDTQLLERLWPARRLTVKVIAGHLPFCVGQKIEPSLRTFTMVRHPADRMLSLLRSQLADADVGPSDLTRLYESSILTNPLAGNHMVRMFGMSAEEMTVGLLTPLELTEEHLQRAIVNLRSVDVIGAQDDVDAFARDLDDTFGWDLGPIGIGNQSRLVPTADGLAERIETDNALDMAFYEHALRERATRPSRRTRVTRPG